MTGPPYEHPSQDNSFSPVDPHAPINYPEYPAYPPAYPPPAYPPPPPYPPGPYQAGPPGYGMPPPYPGYQDPYNPYQRYQNPSSTNGLAIASLVTSVGGLLLGIPLTFVCWIGFLIPVVGVVLGIVALSQIKRTQQQGRGLAIAGISVGGGAIALTVIALVVFVAAYTRTH